MIFNKSKRIEELLMEVRFLKENNEENRNRYYRLSQELNDLRSFLGVAYKDPEPKKLIKL